jgi:CHAD domain-containing protein
MSFKVKRKEAIPESIARIARKCVEKALESCAKEELEAIHATRKQIKRLRALLRLTRRQAGNKEVEQILDCLREAAEYLAPPRDAHVQAQALEQLLGRKRRAKSTERLSATRAELGRDCREEAARFREQKSAREVHAILKKIPAKFKKLHFKHEGWSAIGPGVKTSYQAARKARGRAVREPSSENFHEWRKRVKDLLYNVELLEPIWPEQMCALAGELDTLGELLGDDHDLHMLGQTVIKKSVKPDVDAETSELFALIDPRQKELREKAFKLGSRILQEKPSDFCDRLHGYWKLWKKKQLKRPEDAFSARSRQGAAQSAVSVA